MIFTKGRKVSVRALGVAAMATGLVVATLSAVPAQAEPQHRYTFPIMAGSKLDFAEGHCTVGAVLKKDSIFARLTAYQRSTRYLLTSGHCGDSGKSFSVGGQNVGRIVWDDAESDLQLIEVTPAVRTRVLCHSSSGHALVCTPTTLASPRAVGRIITGERSIPMVGYRDVRQGIVYCTSGAVTGTNCSWKPIPNPFPIVPHPGEAALESSTGVPIDKGDSGGPVYSIDGQILGIICRKGNVGDPTVAMTYINMSEFFRRQPGYSIAPA